jgi:hypothetical protein
MFRAQARHVSCRASLAADIATAVAAVMLGVIEAAPVAEAPPLSPAAPLWRTLAVAGCVGRGLSVGEGWLVAYDCAVDGPPAAMFALSAEVPWSGEAVGCTAVGRGGASSLVVLDLLCLRDEKPLGRVGSDLFVGIVQVEAAGYCVPRRVACPAEQASQQQLRRQFER